MEGRRIDEVRIELPAGLVSIPRSSHEALSEQLQSRDSIADVPDVRDVLARAAEGHHLLGQRGGRQLRRSSRGDPRAPERAPRRSPRWRRRRAERLTSLRTRCPTSTSQFPTAVTWSETARRSYDSARPRATWDAPHANLETTGEPCRSSFTCRPPASMRRRTPHVGLRSWPASAASLCVRWTATRRVGARRAELSERKLLGGRHEQASVRWSRSAYRGRRAPSASCSRPPPSATAAAGPAVAMFPPRLDWQTPRPTEHVALAPGEKMFASGHAAHFDSSARPLLDLGRV